MDNSKDRLIDVFFYGLYMDEEILKLKGTKPQNKRIATANDFKVRVGNMVTLLRSPGSKAHGMIYSLTHDEVYKLYEGAGLDDYVREAVLVEYDNTNIAVLTCILRNEPSADESNYMYLENLKMCMEKYNLPIPSEV